MLKTVLTAMAAVLMTGVSAHAVQVHDLQDDFTDGGSGGTNPTPTGWTYYSRNNVIANVWGQFSTGDFTGPAAVNGWVSATEPDHMAWAKMHAGPYPANRVVEAGDVITHADSALTFTVSATTAGVYDVDVKNYGVRSDGGGVAQTRLLLNGDVVADWTGWTGLGRDNASAVAFLDDVTLVDGDVLRLENGQSAGYVGIQFTLTEVVPEPASVALLGLGGLALLGGRRR